MLLQFPHHDDQDAEDRVKVTTQDALSLPRQRGLGDISDLLEDKLQVCLLSLSALDKVSTGQLQVLG